MRKKNTLLLSNEQCLVLQPSLVRAIGPKAAIFLQQLHYYIQNTPETFGKIINGRKWIYNSAQQWASSLGVMSASTVKRSIAVLKKLKIIEVCCINKNKSDRTNSITIDYNALHNSLLKDNVVPLEKQEKYPTSFTDQADKKFCVQELKMTNSEAQNEPIYNIEPKNTYQDITNKSNQSANIQKNIPQKSSTVQDLLEIWNNEVGNKIQQISQITKERAKYLSAAFKYKFNNCQEKWRNFCQSIASSDFLMGKIKESFKISLDWALKFNTIQRILEGDFGIKPCISTHESEQDISSLEIEINQLKEDIIIKKWRLDVLRDLGKEVYISWFKPCTIEKVNGS